MMSHQNTTISSRWVCACSLSLRNECRTLLYGHTYTIHTCQELVLCKNILDSFMKCVHIIRVPFVHSEVLNFFFLRLVLWCSVSAIFFCVLLVSQARSRDRRVLQTGTVWNFVRCMYLITRRSMYRFVWFMCSGTALSGNNDSRSLIIAYLLWCVCSMYNVHVDIMQKQQMHIRTPPTHNDFEKLDYSSRTCGPSLQSKQSSLQGGWRSVSQKYIISSICFVHKCWFPFFFLSFVSFCFLQTSNQLQIRKSKWIFFHP